MAGNEEGNPHNSLEDSIHHQSFIRKRALSYHQSSFENNEPFIMKVYEKVDEDEVQERDRSERYNEFLKK